jgi:predicted CoA-binding protein
MAHPLEDVIRNAEPFVFIGDSSEDRFPATSYANAARKGHRVYYLDLGGLTESRGPVKGGKVYSDPKEIPDDRTDLAVIWTKPRSAKNAVDVAHQLGAKRVWFSFQTGHRDAVDHARELGMEVVEIGRCPVYYMEGLMGACAAHTLLVKASGLYSKPPQTDPTAKRREMF